ncbi:hypothetical protein Hanom_Chr16g01415691 [Helianthus anomalus]
MQQAQQQELSTRIYHTSNHCSYFWRNSTTQNSQALEKTLEAINPKTSILFREIYYHKNLNK